MRFPIKWKPDYNGFFKLDRDPLFSIFPLSQEWSLKCIWTKDRSGILRPNMIDIWRNSKIGDASVSGTLSILYGQECLLKQRFNRSISAGYDHTTVEFDYDCDVNCVDKIFFIDGHIKISERDSESGSLTGLSDDLGCLIATNVPYFSDVNLKCGSCIIPAHKNILSARSPVFAAMFSNPMKESITNEVDIVDITSSVLRDMLTFIYTGKINNLTVTSAGDLLFVADKYQVQHLRTVCCDYMKSHISVENAIQIFMLGDIYDQDIKAFALEFICSKFNEFSDLEQSKDWKLLLKEKHTLAVELLISLIKVKDEKIKGYRKVQTLSVMGLL
ncbi:unnamed protein product [Larinioides sclopetarius]|uniref:BTB domain-containing protein n=1 Tax=Larinioides sclopetarius TaxID=280406 RepID=A0AAV2AZ23_9ARAC